VLSDEEFKSEYELVPDSKLATVNPLNPDFVLEVTNLDVNKSALFPRGDIVNFHVRGLRGDHGENEGVLSVMAEIDQSAFYPEAGRIIVGSPKKSPWVPGYIPDLGGFCGSPDAIEQLAHVLLRAVALTRDAIAKGK
jgi:hypothetical protein